MRSLSSLVNEKENSIENKKNRNNNLFLNSLMVYNENYKELLKEICKHEKIEMRLLLKSHNGKQRFYKMQDKITRFMHNYLASAVTLINATRNYYNKFYKPFGKLHEYDSKIENEINLQPIKHFIVELRNFIQHTRIPHIFTTSSYKFDGFKETFVHYKYDDLMQSDRWNAKSKIYLNEHKSEIRLKNVVEEYNSLIQNFYKWFLTETEKDLQKDRVYLEKLDESIRIERFRSYLRILLTDQQTVEQFERSLNLYLTKQERRKLEKISDKQKKLTFVLETLQRYGVINDRQVKHIEKTYE